MRHDAPTYGIIDSIIGTAQTPYSAMHDIDANKPGGSIKIRVKTYAASLELHKERLEDVDAKKSELLHRIDRSAWSCWAEGPAGGARRRIRPSSSRSNS